MVREYDEIARKAGIDTTVERVDEVGDTTHCFKDKETLAALNKAKETGEKQILTKFYWDLDKETITIYMLPNGLVVTTSQKGNVMEGN